MKLQSLSREISAMSLVATAFMLCALPSSAQDENAETSASPGSHYEAHPADDQAGQVEETVEAPAPIQQPAARTPAVLRVFHPGDIHVEPNQRGTSPSLPVEDGVIIGGGGSLTQGTADTPVGQGSNSKSGSGGDSNSGGSTPPAGATGAPKSCPSTTARIVPFQGHHIWKLGQNQALAFEFTTGGVDSVGEFDTVETAGAANAPRYLTFSTCPGDFSVTTPGWFRASRNGLTGGLDFYTGTKSYSGRASLQPNTRYYLNIRHASPSAAGLVESCPTSWAGTPVPYCAFWLEGSSNLATGGGDNGGSTGNAPAPSTPTPPRTPSPAGCQWSYYGFSPLPPAPSYECTQSIVDQVVTRGETDKYTCTCR